MPRGSRLFLLAGLALTGTWSACTRDPVTTVAAEPAFSREHPRHIWFQTDWFPQAEHGGFYQALAKGYYREAGLDVEMRRGGPGSNVKLGVARGDSELGMNRSDNLILAAGRENLPLVMVAAVTQHDHEALLVHADSPVRSFADLAGRTVIASPGQAWIYFLQARYGIKFNQIPNKGGLGPFLADPLAIQQCVFTNEPFLARELGVPVRVLVLADAGYDVYTTIFCRREFARDHPAATRAFVQASLRGWRDYLDGDPAPAHEAILKANSTMSPGLLAFSREQLIQHRLVTGDPAKGELIGQISATRLKEQVATLAELKMLEGPVSVNSLFLAGFVPAETR